jgi:hypothetical protein
MSLRLWSFLVFKLYLAGSCLWPCKQPILVVIKLKVVTVSGAVLSWCWHIWTQVSRSEFVCGFHIEILHLFPLSLP